MKNIFKNYLTKQIEKNEQLLSSNSVCEEDKTLISNSIDELRSVLTELENLQDSNFEESLNTLKDTVDKKLEAITEKLQTKKEEQIIMENNYLESKNSLKDFYKAVKESKNGAEFNAAWNKALSENGIVAADAEALLPAAIRGAIKDAWERPANFLNQLKNTGAKRYMVRTASGEGENIRAKGHKKGETKTAQQFTITPKDVKAQMVYKLVPVAAIDEFNDEGDLIAYVMDELSRQWLAEIQRAILVGDGRQSSDVNKINSIEAIARNTTDAYVTVSDFDNQKSLMEQIVDMVTTIEDVDNDGIVLFMSKADLNTLRKVQYSTDATPAFISKEAVAEMIGVKEIFTTTMLGDSYKAIAFVPRGYVTVGFTEPEMYSWIDGYKNETVYRMERPVGGAVEAPKSAAVMTYSV